MKAETQSVVEEIGKSLELLRQRLGWDTAAHRLEELNARSEDPDLWNDPEHAQKVMRDRQKLADAIDGYRALETGLNDNVELIELGEAEDDAEVVAEAVLEKIDGRRLKFTVSASDPGGLVAAGKITRVVVGIDRFMSKCCDT